jgi:uncharacterized protein YecT (DUF1311 family)
MPIDRPADPWSGTTYNGFAGRGEQAAAPPPSAPRRLATPARPSTRTLVLGGVAAAVGLGLVLGVVARPKLDVGGSRASSAATMPVPGAAQVPVAPGAPAQPASVPISVSAPPPAAEPPRAVGRLAVLPPEMTRSARVTAPARTAPRPTPTTLDEQLPPPAAPAPAPMVAEAPPPTLRASFDCESARPGAEQSVCSDPALAAADRRLARAYRRALASGVDPGSLRQEQRDWMSIREDAASRSPRALASVYAQRTAELDEMAAGAPPHDDGE